MREIFPKKLRGDSLPAKQLNDIGQAVRQVSKSMNGSYLSGREATIVPTPPFLQIRAVIQEVLADNLYTIHPRYYNHTDGEWVTDTLRGPFDLDVADLDGTVFIVGDKLDVYWHNQRNAYIPVSASASQNRVVIAKGGAAEAESGGVPGSATMTIWEKSNGAWEATANTIIGYNFSSNAIVANVFLVLVRDSASGLFIIVFEDCP